MSYPNRQKANAYVTPDVVRQTLLDMIDIRSPTGSEAGMADYIVDRLRRAGLDASRQFVEEGRPNAVAHLPGRGDGLNLLFTGHMDTSYSGDEPHLEGEGFRPKGIYRDNWIWGLGASNMKSGLAGLVVALEAIATAGIVLRGDISLGAVVGEIEKAPVEEFQGRDYSGYGIGTKHLVSHGVTADYALLAEPTGMRICTANMGCLWARIKVVGTVAHSALTNKAGTVNAINVARMLCDDIDAWAKEFQDANVFLDEHANVTLAGIRGGDPWRLSRNPYECRLYLDIRTIPGQKSDHIKRGLRTVLRQFAERHRMDEPILDFIITDPALVIDQDLPIVTALAEAQRAVMGQPTSTFLRRPGSDAIHLTRYDVPCVQFGPGGRLHPEAKGRSMHAVGDHVLLDDVVIAARIYLETALICATGQPEIRMLLGNGLSKPSRRYEAIEGRSPMMSARLLLGTMVAAIALTTAARADDFPNRTITLVVSFAPGGLTDVPARMLAPEMQQRLGQPVVVENKAGASGITGDSYVIRSAPDGYTLLISAIAEVQNLYYIHVPYNILTDTTPVGKVADGPPLVLAVSSKSDLKSVADLIAYAKANPTKTNLSTTGPASSPAIAVAQLNSLAGTTIVPVPYNGSGPAATAVVSGDVQGGFVFYPSAAGFVEGGQMRVLAVAGAHRLPNLPNVPTMEELGFKNFRHDAFVGISAPRDTPKSVIAILNKALNDSLASPALQQRLTKFGMSVAAQPNPPEAYGRFMADQVAYQGELAKLPGGLQQQHR